MNETGTSSASEPALDALELELLAVCQEAVRRQHELLPLLAAELLVSENEVFYVWAARKCGQHGKVQGTDWSYFFHGAECDLRNGSDGRFLRIDFGPGGTVDTFTAWGILQFIMTSAYPWPEYTLLKKRFADKVSLYDEHSGNLGKYAVIFDLIRSKGFIEPAASDLLAWQAGHTTKSPEGFEVTRLPDAIPYRLSLDCHVANRSRISQLGYRLLRELGIGAMNGSIAS